MTAARRFALSLVFATAAAGAWADGLSRADVVAQTQAAQAAGAIPHGDLDITARGADVHPAAEGASLRSRAAVRAELARAVAAGDVQVGDEGRTLAEIDPSRYPRPAAAPGLTRAQVRAELAQAIRDGDVPVGDEGRTEAEVRPLRYAAARAADARMAMASAQPDTGLASR